MANADDRNEIVPREIEADIPPPWGEAPEDRGERYEEEARTFIAAHPHGTILTRKEFDDWAADEGYIEKAPSRKSKAWEHHLRCRHDLKKALNLAGLHKRMGADAFKIVVIKGGRWEVITAKQAIENATALRKLTRYIKTQRRNNSLELQAVDYDKEDPRLYLQACFQHSKLEDALDRAESEFKRYLKQKDEYHSIVNKANKTRAPRPAIEGRRSAKS